MAIITRLQIIQIVDTIIQALKTLNWYQVIALIIQVFILCVLVYTARYIKKQLKTQNKILEMQLLKDRITLGWLTDEPITKKHIKNIDFLPKDFLPEKYKTKYTNMKTMVNTEYKKEIEVELGKYLYLAKVYDYFLYSYILYGKEKMNFKDHWGDKWEKQWLKGLTNDEVFKDIMVSNRASYSDFHKHLQSFQSSNNN